MAELTEKGLKTIGFSEFETNIYLAIYRTGPLPLSEVIRISRFSKTETIQNLNNLMNKGHIEVNKQGELELYQTANPDALELLVAEKKSGTGIYDGD